MKKGNFKTLPMKNLEEQKGLNRGQITFSSAKVLLEWYLNAVVSFLVDFLRFEAARSSKVAIFGLWIGPNSNLGRRE